MSRRIDRVNELLRYEISQLLSRQVKDPRLTGIISITRVHTANDLRSAQVSLSVMGDAGAKQEALQGIRSAAAYIRKELRGRLAMRHVPFLSFTMDTSIEDADQLLQMMDRIREHQASPNAGHGPDGKPLLTDVD